jgi:hypothetical protein
VHHRSNKRIVDRYHHPRTQPGQIDGAGYLLPDFINGDFFSISAGGFLPQKIISVMEPANLKVKMKRSVFYSIIVLLAISCEKDTAPTEEDYRTPYTGLFTFTTVKSTMVMCYDTVFPCVDGWKEIDIDTNIIISAVEKNETDRIKIKFGDSIIGIDDKGNTIRQTIYPKLLSNGALVLPEYPVGGHNRFTGLYKGYDTIEINLQFGYGMGGYDKYKILGIRNMPAVGTNSLNPIILTTDNH